MAQRIVQLKVDNCILVLNETGYSDRVFASEPGNGTFSGHDGLIIHEGTFNTVLRNVTRFS